MKGPRMGYITPADVGVSDNRAKHLARKSAEPGTDYKTPYGTDLRAPEDCVVLSVDHSNNGAEGRRISFLIPSNGEVIDWIHLARIDARVGDRFDRAERGIALSGASGFGEDHYYGPHVHVTRRARRGLPFSQTLDFEDAVGARPAPASSNATSPSYTPTPKEIPMAYIANVKHGEIKGQFLVTEQGNAQPTALGLGGSAKHSGFPVVDISDFSDSFWQTVRIV